MSHNTIDSSGVFASGAGNSTLHVRALAMDAEILRRFEDESIASDGDDDGVGVTDEESNEEMDGSTTDFDAESNTGGGHDDEVTFTLDETDEDHEESDESATTCYDDEESAHKNCFFGRSSTPSDIQQPQMSTSSIPAPTPTKSRSQLSNIDTPLSENFAEFSLFPFLPVELRFRIWQFGALLPHTIHINYDVTTRGEPVYNYLDEEFDYRGTWTIQNPRSEFALSRVCKEAAYEASRVANLSPFHLRRRMSLGRNTPRYHNLLDDPLERTLINWETDIVFLSSNALQQLTCNVLGPAQFPILPHAIWKIKSLAIDMSLCGDSPFLTGNATSEIEVRRERRRFMHHMMYWRWKVLEEIMFVDGGGLVDENVKQIDFKNGWDFTDDNFRGNVKAELLEIDKEFPADVKIAQVGQVWY